MTIEEFLVELAQTPRGWRLDDQHRLRLTAPGRCIDGACPVVAALGYWPRAVVHQFANSRVYRIAQVCGLPDPDCDRIVEAADHRDRTPLRLRLLVACGL